MLTKIKIDKMDLSTRSDNWLKRKISGLQSVQQAAMGMGIGLGNNFGVTNKYQEELNRRANAAGSGGNAADLQQHLEQDHGYGKENVDLNEGLKTMQDEAILNPVETQIGGNIQPGAYNLTGFSQGAVDASNQMFNTPEERNKII